jgi:hypothetical protein
MTPFHYKARILPDGHLPVPADFHVRAGEEIDVTLLPAEHENGAADASRRAEHLLKTWAGVGRGSGAGVAERHDEHLYER